MKRMNNNVFNTNDNTLSKALMISFKTYNKDLYKQITPTDSKNIV